MALDRSRQLAVTALVEQLKGMIERRVEHAHSAGSAASSWNLLNELKSLPQWTGDPHTDADRARGQGIVTSYTNGLAKLKAAEDEVWAAIADLLKN